MIQKIKNWWFKITHIKCNYCKEPVAEYHDAYIFPIKDYKGGCICINCIKKLPNQKNIVYVNHTQAVGV